MCRLLDDFDNKGRKVCCKVSLYKNCQRQSYSAFNSLSSGINILAGDDPFPLKSCLQVTCPLLSMVWEMSELITQEGISVGSSNLVEGLITWPAMYDHWPKSKGQRSRSQGHVTHQQQYRYNKAWSYQLQTWMETVIARCASRDILSRSVGQLERK